MVSRRVSPSQIPFRSVEGMNFRMVEDRGIGVREITTPTSHLISGLVPRHTHMRRYSLETHLFPMTKPSLFGNNIQFSTVHNLWPILQVLLGAPAVCQDLDTVLIREESMIESTTESNEFQSKDGSVLRIPLLFLTSLPGVLLNIPLPVLSISESGNYIREDHWCR
ncbi:hypothetical protein TNCV_2679401 [Trichonephila clavipes]|nr:hypothetical protein TNCV_2679401 [Trichonephila clavipes]